MPDMYLLGMIHATEALGFEKTARMGALQEALIAYGPGVLAGAGAGAGAGALAADEGNRLRAALLGALIGGGGVGALGAAGHGIHALGSGLSRRALKGSEGLSDAAFEQLMSSPAVRRAELLQQLGYGVSGPAMGPSLGMSIGGGGGGSPAMAAGLGALGAVPAVAGGAAGGALAGRRLSE